MEIETALAAERFRVFLHGDAVMVEIVYLLYDAAKAIFELPPPAAAAVCLSPLFLWWLMVLVKYRRDRVAVQRVALGGGGLLLSAIIAWTLAVFTMRLLVALKS